jgi:hypothetical protein
MPRVDGFYILPLLINLACGVTGSMLVAPVAARRKVGSSSGGDGSTSGTSTTNLSSCGQRDDVHVQ